MIGNICSLYGFGKKLAFILFRCFLPIWFSNVILLLIGSSTGPRLYLSSPVEACDRNLYKHK